MDEIVLVTVTLEEKLLVSPTRGDHIGAGHNPADLVVLTTELGRLIVCEDLEEASVCLDNGELVVEVVLVGIGPAVDIIRLKVDHEWPVGLLDSTAAVVILGHLHDGHGADMVGAVGEALGVGGSGALVLGLSKDVRVPVLEVVERWLAVEGEGSNQVGGGHAISQTLELGVGGGLRNLRGGRGELRDADETVLAALEDTSVWRVVGWDKLSLGDATSGHNSLDAAKWHGVRDGVVDLVHVRCEDSIEFLTDEESLWGLLVDDLFPDDLLLAVSAELLILRGIEMVVVIRVRALRCLRLIVLRLGIPVLSLDGQNSGSKKGG